MADLAKTYLTAITPILSGTLTDIHNLQELLVIEKDLLRIGPLLVFEH